MQRNILNSASTPLQQGINLVEASAGTGKTYAIAMLVLRSVVELRLPLEKILVVTFTKAATEELRSRIRQRLLQAKHFLDNPVEADDPTLAEWLKTVDDRALASKLLQLAIVDIDRAAVFTIHSFCQRMLSEQALESGQMFDAELLADTRELQHNVITDYWRCVMYPLPARLCGLVIAKYPTPDSLYTSVAGIRRGDARIEPAAAAPETTLRMFERSYDALAGWWQISAEELKAAFLQSLNNGHFKKPLSECFHQWWQDLDSYFSGKAVNLPEHLEFLTFGGLATTLNGRKVKKRDQQEYLAGFPLPDELTTELLSGVEQVLLAFRCDAAAYVNLELKSRLHQQGQLSFDDLITRLDTALSDKNGELQRLIADRFSCALIDEFQDTDRAQWRIFSRLFSGPSHYLYLIGDPKQAIYRFRGADIHTYFAARREAAYHLTLPKNYRSHPQLVEAVNSLFEGRCRPFNFSEQLLSFQPVTPAKTTNDGALFSGGEPLPVMEYCQLLPASEANDGRWSSGKASDSIREFIVAETKRLLSTGSPTIQRSCQNESLSEDTLKAQEIAVLVRSNRQADDYVQAFARAGIPVVVASKKSVFETEEARELSILLQALSVPGDVYRLKAAMTISWFGLSGDELYAVWNDEAVFDRWFNRFVSYYQEWQENGVLAMMNRLLFAEEVYTQLARQVLAERRIANIHHLLELVQSQEAQESFGPEQIVLWLRSHLAGYGGAEERELRLESDEEAVRIITMHGAKGLQFPVVFCPFLWYRPAILRNAKDAVSCHDENSREIIDLGSSRFEERKSLALQEELAEELRLLYVALTRAELRSYVMWADVKNSSAVMDSFDSALGYLLFADGKISYTAQCAILSQLAELPGCSHIQVETAMPEIGVRRSGETENPSLRPLPPGKRSFVTSYQMSSYSAMASLSDYDDHGTDVTTDMAKEQGLPILHQGLPAGAPFGNLVHDSLETFSFRHFLEPDTDLRHGLGHLRQRYGLDVEIEQVMALLASTVQTPLHYRGAIGDKPFFSLADLSETHCLKEMPFYFHLSSLETRQINTILAAEPTVVPLSPQEMQGYLTGFIDLVCEHDGKYFILDYKTNFLGNSREDYTQEKLIKAMAAHNYGLQYWIYTLVLHRYLQNTHAGYDYKRHFGGVMYLFVRGMVPDDAGNGVFSTLPCLDTLKKLSRVVGGHDGF